MPEVLEVFLTHRCQTQNIISSSCVFFFLGLLSAKGKENYWQKQEGPGRLSFLQEHIFSVFTV